MGTFSTWLLERHQRPVIPAHFAVLDLVKRAGEEGMSRGELAELVDLESEDLEELLAAYAGFGLLTARQENGKIVYRSAGGLGMI